MVNEKFRERVPAWVPFQRSPEQFPAFFHKVMELSLNGEEKEITLKEQTSLLVFLDHCFTSMEVDLIRNQIQRLVSVSKAVLLFETLFYNYTNHPNIGLVQ